MSNDISRMSNQERINLLGSEEADKYHGPYKRRKDTVDYFPACDKLGGSFYLAELSLKEEAEKKGKTYKMQPTPNGLVLPTVSFRFKGEKETPKQAFKRSGIKSTKRSRKRAKTS